MRMHISAVIPTYNNQNTIERCIESILNQTKKFDEIIVVDDGSTDGTSEIVKKFPVKMIRIEHKGRPGARNVGWKRAKGDVIAFIEADSYYNEIWLEEVLKKLKNADIVNHRRRAWSTETPFQRVFDKILIRRWETVKDRPITGWTFKKEVLEDLKGFDESLPRAQDVDLGQRALKKGYTISTTGDAIEYHRGDAPSNFKELMKRSRHYGENMMPFYLRYPKRFPLKMVFFAALPFTVIQPFLFVFLLSSFILLTCARGLIFLKLSSSELPYYPAISLVDNYSFLYGFLKTLVKKLTQMITQNQSNQN